MVSGQGEALAAVPPWDTEPNLIDIPSTVSEAKYDARHNVRVRRLRRSVCANKTQACDVVA